MVYGPYSLFYFVFRTVLFIMYSFSKFLDALVFRFWILENRNLFIFQISYVTCFTDIVTSSLLFN